MESNEDQSVQNNPEEKVESLDEMEGSIKFSEQGDP